VFVYNLSTLNKRVSKASRG